MPSEEYDSEAYLTSVSNGLEAEVVEGLLRSNGIPVLKKFREAGGYLEIYMGGSNFGVDLYVPSKLLETAKGIISSRPDMAEESEVLTTFEKDQEEEFDKLAESNMKKRRIINWIIVLILFPGLLIIAFQALNALIDWFINIF